MKAIISAAAIGALCTSVPALASTLIINGVMKYRESCDLSGVCASYTTAGAAYRFEMTFPDDPVRSETHPWGTTENTFYGTATLKIAGQASRDFSQASLTVWTSPPRYRNYNFLDTPYISVYASEPFGPSYRSDSFSHFGRDVHYFDYTSTNKEVFSGRALEGFIDGGPIRFYKSPGAYIPEPSTWGLFIIGFGAIGGALRRKQASASHVTLTAGNLA